MEMTYIWIALLCATSAFCADYSQLQRMGVACRPRDTCRRTTTDFQYTNCQCGRSCLLYNDCCVDGQKRTRSSPKKIKGLMCIPLLSYQGVYGLSRCSNSWNGPSDVKSKCESGEDFSDPLMSVPVTQTRKKETYRNLYCAACNSASTSSLIFWNLRIICNSLSEEQSGYNNITEQFIRENLVRVGNSWGVHHWNKKVGRTSFYPCDLKFSLPRSVENSVRYCRPNLVSSCAHNWNRESERKDCESYMGVVYLNGQGYRNAHCALCSDVPLQNVRCSPPAETEIDTKYLTLSALIDIYKPSTLCSKEQVYDSIFKKCRRLFCNNPSHVPRGGKCVEF